MILRPFKLCILLATLSVSWAYAQVPDGLMPYDHPDILKVKPKKHDDVLPQIWKESKRGHLETVAQLLELYPEHEIYFLARDAELLYDFARLATVDEPSDSKRIHLLNVSRKNVRSKDVKAYLAQEGISESVLKSGRKNLFVDSGFMGSIPQAIEVYFSSEFRKSFQTRMLLSSNQRHPSIRVFLRSIYSDATAHAIFLADSIRDYEKMPHFTDRSTQFAKVNESWVPLVPHDGSASDGRVDGQVAKMLQESLVDYQRSEEAKVLFQERRAIYRKLYQLRDDPKQFKEELQSILKQPDPFNEALVMDVVETENLHRGNRKIRLKDLGIKLQVAPSCNELLKGEVQ